MLSNSDIVQILKDNLADERMFAHALMISQLSSRKATESTIEQKRLYDTKASAFVADMTGYLAALDADELRVEYPWEGEKLSGDRCTGFYVTPTNIEVVFNDRSIHDVFFSRLGYDLTRRWNIMFYVCYMNDADPVMSLKISWVKLVPVR